MEQKHQEKLEILQSHSNTGDITDYEAPPKILPTIEDEDDIAVSQRLQERELLARQASLLEKQQEQEEQQGIQEHAPSVENCEKHHPETIMVDVAAANMTIDSKNDEEEDNNNETPLGERRRRHLFLILCAGIVILLVLVSIITGVILAKKEQDDDDDDLAKKEQDDDDEVPVPSTVSAEVMNLVDRLTGEYPELDLVQLLEDGSPQNCAIHWLALEDDWTTEAMMADNDGSSSSIQQIVERYALAVIFYATATTATEGKEDGGNITNVLRSEVSVCSISFHSQSEDFGQDGFQRSTDLDEDGFQLFQADCNEDGYVTYLDLRKCIHPPSRRDSINIS